MFTIKELENLNLTKGDLIKKMDVENYDTALPQNWLNNFVDETGLDYHLVLSTTVWSYDNGHGKPISGCLEVQQKILAIDPIENFDELKKINDILSVKDLSAKKNK